MSKICNVTGSDSSAFQLHQTEPPSGAPLQSPSSSVSSVACARVPMKAFELPVSTTRFAKLSFAGGLADNTIAELISTAPQKSEFILLSTLTWQQVRCQLVRRDAPNSQARDACAVWH